MRSSLIRALGATLVACAFAAGCGDGTHPVAASTLELSVTTGSIPIDQTLTIVAQVKDASGTVLPGRVVTFATSDATKATVSGSGVVTAVAPGPVTITATSGTATAQAHFTITAGPPASITKVDGDAQSGTVGAALGTAFFVKVGDAKGNPVSGVAVTWNTTAGGGSLGGVTAITDIDGHATARLTLGFLAGANTATATAVGVTPVATFTATALWSTVRDDWTTYGHDAARTSASATTIATPLHLSWRYLSVGVAGHALQNTTSMLATADAVFLRTSLSSGYGYGRSPALDRVTLAGAKVWTYNTGTDADFGDWGSIWSSRFIINDDGVRFVDLTTGSATVALGVDSWGETLSDATAGLFLANDVQIDGPGIYVGSLDATGQSRWQKNAFATCRGSASSTAGGMALANSTLFYAPVYNVGQTTTHLPFASGVYAFNATTGAQLAYVATVPYSRISADAQRVYLIEGGNTLVARAQSDLHVVWSKPVTGPGEQAPVIANNLAIIGTSSSVEAYNLTTGAKTWTSGALTGADAHWSSTYQGGSCGAVQIPEGSYAVTTTLAAALGSNTLIVTAYDGIHILSLGDGSELWKGAVPQSSGRVRNPVIVNDPVKGPIVYVMDYSALFALVP
ncbi:MAG: Ig-like domain-containing protein [Gemmatimonadota bacterium]|nr:Ig-like domain-containing protein [Gemmatimonadota bacterium]